MVILELSEPFGRAHPVFSCIPLSRWKLQVVCRRERLHVTAFGKTARLSLGRASNCITILYFDGVSKYSCMERFLVLSNRAQFPPHNFHPPSDSPQ